MGRREIALVSIVAPAHLDVDVRLEHGRLNNPQNIQQIRPSTSVGLSCRLSLSLSWPLCTPVAFTDSGEMREKDGLIFSVWVRML